MAWWISNTGQVKQSASNPGGWLGPYPTRAAAQAVLGGGSGSGGGAWYVITIRRTPQTPFTVEVAQKPFPSGSGITALQDSGPYATQAEAQAAADKLKKAPIPGLVNSPLSGIGGFLANLSSGNLWLRLAEGAIGLILLAIGLSTLLKGTPAGDAAGTVTKAIPKVIPV
jgi:hypothetical protein